MDKNKSLLLLLATAGLSLSVAATAIATPITSNVNTDNTVSKVESITTHSDASFLGNGSCNANGSCH